MSLVPLSSFDLIAPAADLAERISGTDFVPTALRRNGPAVLACILFGHELGVGPMESLAQIHMIEGRAAPSAQLARAQAFRRGHRIWTEEHTSTRVILCGQRKDDDIVHRVTWTMDDARKAGLAGRQNWQRYPRPMLLARATAELVRLAFPDVLGPAAVMSEELADGDGFAALGEGEGTTPAVGDKPASRRRRPPARKAIDTSAGEAVESEAVLGPARPPLPDEPLEYGDPPAKITDAQKRKLMAGCKDAGIDDRNDRLAFASGIVGRDIGSANDLTVDEAGRVIDALATVGDGRAALVLDEGDRPVGVRLADAREPTQETLDAAALADELKARFETTQES